MTHAGQRVKRFRERNKLSQREMARRVGVSNGYISLLESGGTEMTAKAAVKFAAVMRCKAHTLCTWRSRND